MKAILLERYRAIYIVIPKIGATSFKTLFAAQLGIDLASGSPRRVRFPEPRGRWPLVLALRYRNYFKFGFVRNPWARLVSCYKDKIQNTSSSADTHFTIRSGVADCLARFDAFFPGMSFDAFVDAVASIPDEEANPHFRSQHTFFDKRSGLPADFIGKFESVAEDWRVVRGRIGFPEIDLPRRKSTPSTDFRSFYTRRTRDLVEKRFAKDVEMFEYEF